MKHLDLPWLIAGMLISIVTGLAVYSLSDNPYVVAAVVIAGTMVLVMLQSLLRTRSVISIRNSRSAAEFSVRGLKHSDVNVLTAAIPGIFQDDSVVRGIETIEELANDKLGSSVDRSSLTLFQLRSALEKREIWTHADVEAFDRAMAVRNRIVHGDHPVSNVELRRARTDILRLLRLLTDKASVEPGLRPPPGSQAS